ncbi:UDP-N-acetylglucosamine 2-epimerase (non-hydrolyzing) [Geobacter sp. FeAm09]|uniref:non-hydrolyzing UDP-N-acetylglucosamine 2-epimerase n=1 Tax=Geobacter sp. FeAm09 TaxID=2597769 RepID=UPI0011EF0848|nr:UDP-N-acetylglucosamine 2-epimerase (non-hydrolyzing) [Geobacter sp. FeAm09]QEM69764.1 UDP-N-acetylglucosamine 2-epimerase (non-hydrolyzing) [Geobacter sp. FeAm09]
MKILTILGTRPEIIRLSRIVAKLDQLCDHVVVHTGQNYDVNLNDIFFQQLGVRAPDHYLGAKGSFGEQLGTIVAGMERVFDREKPDRFLVLGDTNSSLGAIAAKRMGIPVYHMEAGNRCYDDRVPEEVNRRIIDHSSDILLPYTERSRQNLLREGIPGERIYVTGNPINEVINHYQPQIAQSRILEELGVAAGKYFLVTMHRAENVDIKERIESLTTTFARLQKEYGLPFIISTHPRTRARMEQFGMDTANPLLRFMPPFGFFEFITLERNAFCVLSDSGTVQEECAIFGVPNVTIRDVTERPETLECGSNMLSGAEVESVMTCVKTVLSAACDWEAPKEYRAEQVSEVVTKIVLGYR